MAEILYLVHRFPWPPNKGDKIRSYHVLRHLAARYRVHLGTFVDDPHDWRYLAEVEDLCESVCALPLARLLGQVRAMRGLFSGKPLTLPWYQDRRLHKWVCNVLRERQIGAALAFSSSMGQYLPLSAQLRRVVDFVDVDSDKWRQYAQTQGFPMSLLYSREARLLGRYEQRLAERCHAGLFVSEQEVALFKSQADAAGDTPRRSRLEVMGNGVDTDYFTPQQVGDSPYPLGELPLVLSGAMDYWPNVDAACWFARQVLPGVRRRFPHVHFYVVGNRPTPAVQALGGVEEVTVTGFVDDIRPWIGHAALAVAPLRVARGVQNKVLEAMALARPVVASSEALEGLDVEPEHEVRLVEAQPEAFVRAILELLNRQAAAVAMGAAARERVINDYSWAGQLGLLDELLAVDSIPPATAPPRRFGGGHGY